MLSTFGTRKSIALPFVSTGALLACLSLTVSGCLIIEVDIDKEVNGNSVIVLRIVVQNDDADANPWRGVQMVLVPDDWIFNSGTYDANDKNGVVGTGILVESTDWADSAAIGVYPAPAGMKWIGLISDAAYSHGDTLLIETNVEFTTGMKVGTFPVGIVVTKENFFPSTGDWFATSGNAIVGADSSMMHYVTVAPPVDFNCTVQSQIPSSECDALVALYDSTDGDNWIDNAGWKVTNAPCSWFRVVCSGGHVTQLELIANGLVGSVPDAIGGLDSLKVLSLELNGLFGSIPDAIGDLSNLESLALNSNAFTGSIPTSVANLTQLQFLWLHGNSLTGPIPASLGNLPLVQYIVLGSNNLSGSIPHELGSLPNLFILSLGSNGLTGSIPESLGDLSALYALELDSNSLTGPIPASLGNLSGLDFLRLESNNLQGTVPLPVAKRGSLVSLCDFTDNHLSLCIPDTTPYQALATGGFLCGLPLDPACEPIVHMDATVYMEGPYSGGAMVHPPAFSNYLPTTQPYSDPFFNGTPLDHDNPDVVLLPPDSVLDWVLVSLRSDPTAASEVVGSERTAFLLENGSIVDTSGTMLAFPGVAPDGYHLVIRHRNHASVMSADTLDLSDGIGSWDFTPSMAQAYTTGGGPMKDLGDGSFGMFACDANADGQVTAPDFNLWNASTTAGATGYQQGDCNMDGQVTAPDFNLWNANTTAGASSKVPE